MAVCFSEKLFVIWGHIFSLGDVNARLFHREQQQCYVMVFQIFQVSLQGLADRLFFVFYKQYATYILNYIIT